MKKKLGVKLLSAAVMLSVFGFTIGNIAMLRVASAQEDPATLVASTTTLTDVIVDTPPAADAAVAADVTVSQSTPSSSDTTTPELTPPPDVVVAVSATDTPSIPLDMPLPSPESAPTPASDLSTPSTTIDSTVVDTPSSTPVVDPTPAEVPQLSTEYPDYHPGETATIFGRFFGALQHVVLKIFGDDGQGGNYTETSQDVTTNDQGSFVATYLLDNIYRPIYNVVASTLGGEKLADTTFADSAVGPNTATVGATVTGIGSTAWTNPGNINAAGTASLSLSSNASSNYLRGTGFGFSIPAAATINGIQVTINRTGASGGSGGIQDNRVYLVKDVAGSPVIQTSGTNAATATQWPTSLGSATYGATNDLWGNTWTVADINSANFGVAISALNQSNSQTRIAQVDYIQVTVTYTLNIPDLSISKTNDTASGIAGVGSLFNWTLAVANSGSAAATFATGTTVITDNLPSTGATYGTIATSTTGITSGVLNCSVASANLTCVAGRAITIPVGATISITLPTTGTIAGPLANPRSGGVCTIATATGETNTANNSCSDSVTVQQLPDLVVAKSNNTANAGQVGTPYNWVLTISNSGQASASFGFVGMSVLTDDLPTTGATYGTPTFSVGGGTTGTLSCAVVASTLDCNTASALTIPVGGTVTITVPVTPTVVGTLTNPRSGGACSVDPTQNITQGSTINDGCNVNTVTITDTTPPTVLSIVRASSTPTASLSVPWTVTFSESVTGVDAADFTLVNAGLTGSPAITSVTGSGTTYKVTATTGVGAGTLGLNLVDNDTIVDPSGNKLGGTGVGNGNLTGEVYTVDKTAPTVTVEQAVAQADPTSTSPVNFTVVFSKPVSGFATGDVTITGTSGGTKTGTVTGSGTTYNVAVTGMTGSGTVIASLGAGKALDALGNLNATSTSVDNTVSWDAIDLLVTLSNNVAGALTLPGTYNWTLVVQNSGTAPASFASGQSILSDSLPSSNATYGAINATVASGTTGVVACTVVSNNMTCTASGGSVVIPAGGTVTVVVPVTPSATGTFSSPRSGGSCSVDPLNVISEGNEANNTCATNSVVVSAFPDLVATKTNDAVASTVVNGATYNWKIHIANDGTANATWTGGFLSKLTFFTDNLPSSGATYGTITVTPVGVTGTVLCTIATSNLTCTTNGAFTGNAVTMPAGSSIDVTVPVTATAVGSLVNPRAAGSCKIDSGNTVTESNEANNTCADTVTVIANTGTLKIVKNTTEGNGTFSFAVTGPSASTPSITTVGTTGASGPTTVTAGTYSVKETIPSGWALQSASCDDGSSTLTTDTISGVSVTPGKNVICTFTNKDTVAPVITLLGSTPITVEYASTYVDAGATASDNFDGNVTANIITVNPVNTNIIGNYSVTYNVSDSQGNAALQATRVVHVGKAAQSITFGALSNKTYGNADFSVSASANSGLTVDFTALGNCSVTGTSVHITGAGSCTVTAHQAGDINYSAASDVPQSFSIGQATSATVISCPNPTETYTGSALTPCSATVTGAGGLNQSVPVSYDANTVVGTATAHASYAGDVNHSGSSATDVTFDIVVATSATVISCPNPTETYTGSALTPCSATVTGAGGLNQSVPVSYDANTVVGTATAHASYAGDVNHSGSSATDVTFDIVVATSATVISCPNPTETYTGSALTPCSATVTGAGGLNQSVPVSYDANTVVGTATAHASYAGDVNHSGSSATDVTFDIVVATSATVISCPNPTETYTGSALTPCSATVTGAGGLNQSVPVSYDANTVVGTATAHASYAGDVNHSGSSATDVTFDIVVATSATVISCPNPTETYTGSALTPCSATVTGAGGLNQSVPVSYDANTVVGTATAHASYAGDVNHSGSSATDVTFDIVVATSATVISCPNPTETYTGSALTPCSATVTGAGGLNQSVPVSYDANTVVGTATAHASYAGDVNHSGSSATDVTFDIVVATSATVISCPNPTETYTGSALTPCSATVTGAGGLNQSVPVSYDANTVVGTATAHASYAGDVNHSGSSATDVTFDIVVATSATVISCPNPTETYTGSALTPCSATVTGAGGLNQSVPVSYDANTVVGTATAHASYAGDVNHSGSSATDVTFDIVVATSATVISCPNPTETYTGSALTPCSATVTGAGGLNQSVPVSYDANTVVGTATAHASYAGDVNHSGSSATDVTFDIVVATSATVISCPNPTETYTGSALTPCSATVTGAGGLNQSVPVSYDANTVVGTATAHASYAGDVNHSGSSATDVTFDIVVATSATVISCPNPTETYTGSALTPCSATVTGAGGLNQSVPVSYDANTVVGTATAHASYAGDVNHSGSSATDVTFDITDGGAPVIAPHADVIVEATSVSGATVTYTNPVASDNVDGTDSVTCAPASGSVFGFGTTSIACNAQDTAGNHATTTHFAVGVVDTTKPVIILLGSASTSVEVGTTYTDAGATASDNIDGNITPGIVTGSTVSTSTIGNYTVSYDVTDSHGNHATQVVRQVHVIDHPAPVISLQSAANVSTSSVTITWTTDHPATSRVLYDTVSHGILGSAPNYGYANSTLEDGTKVLNHSVTVTGLTSGTPYFFRTVSHGSPESVGTEIATTTKQLPIVVGQLYVIKRTQGGDGTFSFGGSAGLFTITTTGGTGNSTISNLLPGSYSVTENTLVGWILTQNGCTNVRVSSATTTTCTITNTKLPTLTVNKVVVPASDTGRFNLLIDSVVKATNVGNGGTTGIATTTIGTHTVAELAGAGSNLAYYTAVISGDCATNGTVTLAAGENKVCTITNTKKNSQLGEISGIKYNDLNRNGKKDVNEPGLKNWKIRLLDAKGNVVTYVFTDANGNYKFSNLSAGTYKVREAPQSGWKRISKNNRPIVITGGTVVTGVNIGNAAKLKIEREDTQPDCDRDDY